MYELEQLKHLSQVHEDKDVRQMTYAIANGNHCPLYGVARVTAAMKDFAVLICGTEECTWYTKVTRIAPLGVNGKSYDNIYSYVYTDKDITFGAAGAVLEAVGKVRELCAPKAILLVSSCIPSMIGDDFVMTAAAAREKWKLPVLPVAIDHFKCASHTTGVERVLAALCGLMEPKATVPGSYNLLGLSNSILLSSELIRVLEWAGLKQNETIPCNAGLESIKNAPAAQVNIVVDPVALPMAQEMERRFHIPYARFYKYVVPDRIARAYDRIGMLAGRDLNPVTKPLYREANEQAGAAADSLRGVTYYFANYFLLPFESCAFLSALGMKAFMIHARDYTPEDEEAALELLGMGEDPYVCRAGNMGAMEPVYRHSGTRMMVGIESPVEMRKYGIVLSSMMGVTQRLGYELSSYVASSAKKDWEERQRTGRGVAELE